MTQNVFTPAISPLQPFKLQLLHLTSWPNIDSRRIVRVDSNPNPPQGRGIFLQSSKFTVYWLTRHMYASEWVSKQVYFYNCVEMSCWSSIQTSTSNPYFRCSGPTWEGIAEGQRTIYVVRQSDKTRQPASRQVDSLLMTRVTHDLTSQPLRSRKTSILTALKRSNLLHELRSTSVASDQINGRTASPLILAEGDIDPTNSQWGHIYAQYSP